jgi:hypothetical protein
MEGNRDTSPLIINHINAKLNPFCHFGGRQVMSIVSVAVIMSVNVTVVVT